MGSVFSNFKVKGAEWVQYSGVEWVQYSVTLR